MSTADSAFGRKGPENVLIPLGSAKDRRSTVRELKDASKAAEEQLEMELGFDDERQELRKASDAEFNLAVGQTRTTMDADLFVETVMQAWQIERRSAFACFLAAAKDCSNAKGASVTRTSQEMQSNPSLHRFLDRHTYLLLREAFVHAPSEHSENVVIRRLRLRAIWHRADADHSGSVSRVERLGWLRDVCTGEGHVERIASSLFSGWGEHCSIDEMVDALEVGSLEERLGEHGLSMADVISVFRSPEEPPFRRVVYDGRAETAKPPTQSGGAGGGVLGSGVLLATGGGGGGGGGVRGRGGGRGSPGGARGRGRGRGAMGALQEGVTTAGVPGYAINESLSLQPELRAVGGWRGAYQLALQRDSKTFGVAVRVIEAAMDLAHRARWLESDREGDGWLSNGVALAAMLGADESAQAASLTALAGACRRVVAAQPMLVRVAAPVKLFGDVHGQLRDLLLLFAYYGAPTHKGGDVQTTSYVFNGDWVDRGPHQLEVVALLFALKAMYPQRIYLLRGNHEFRDMNEAMAEHGFRHACTTRLPQAGARVYEAIHDTFDWLPIGALVAGRVLVLHGGVGDGSWGLKELAEVQRPLNDAHRELVALQALWSDPSDSDSAMRRGVHESGRGEDIPEFGVDVTERFCEANGLALVVRSHQYVRHGYKVMHGGRLITLFSARNYFQRDGQTNDGAMLLLTPDCNGHLRIHPKRLAHLADGEARPAADDDWRVQLLRAISRCLLLGDDHPIAGKS